MRSFPSSKLNHFKRANLASFLEKEEVEYHCLGKELEGYRKGGYENYIRTKEFELGINALEAVADVKTSAIICAERFPWKCHRQFIARALHQRKWEVAHIIDKGKVWVLK